jgi:hypothetical protein
MDSMVISISSGALVTGRGLRPSLPRNALAVAEEGETMSIKESNEKG